MNLCLSLGILCALPCSAYCVAADSIGPYWDRRVAPRDCAYYAVIEKRRPHAGEGGRLAEITVAKQPLRGRREPAITGWYSDDDGPLGSSVLRSRAVAVVEGDSVLGRFTLRFFPKQILMSSRSFAVAAVGRIGRRSEHADAELVVIARASGEVVRGLTLADLFGAGAEKISPVAGRAWRLPDLVAWIDESRGILIVVAEPPKGDPLRPIALVSLVDGTVRRGHAKDIVRSIEVRNGVNVAVALRVLNDIRAPLTRGQLRRVYTAQGLPHSARVIAAGMLGEAGDSEGAGLLVGLARRGAQLLRDDPSFDVKANWLPVLGEIIGHDDQTEEYLSINEAVRFLPNVAGEACVPLLAQIGARSRRGLRERAHDAAVSLGADGVHRLLPLLAEGRDADARMWAAAVIGDLGNMGSAAVETLAAVLEPKSAAGESVRAAAARALGCIGADAADAQPTLRKCLTDPSDRVRRAAASALSKIESAKACRPSDERRTN